MAKGGGRHSFGRGERIFFTAAAVAGALSGSQPIQHNFQDAISDRGGANTQKFNGEINGQYTRGRRSQTAIDRSSYLGQTRTALPSSNYGQPQVVRENRTHLMSAARQFAHDNSVNNKARAGFPIHKGESRKHTSTNRTQPKEMSTRTTRTLDNVTVAWGTEQQNVVQRVANSGGGGKPMYSPALGPLGEGASTGAEVAAWIAGISALGLGGAEWVKRKNPRLVPAMTRVQRGILTADGICIFGACGPSGEVAPIRFELTRENVVEQIQEYGAAIPNGTLSNISCDATNGQFRTFALKNDTGTTLRGAVCTADLSPKQGTFGVAERAKVPIIVLDSGRVFLAGRTSISVDGNTAMGPLKELARDGKLSNGGSFEATRVDGQAKDLMWLRIGGELFSINADTTSVPTAIPEFVSLAIDPAMMQVNAVINTAFQPAPVEGTKTPVPPSTKVPEPTATASGIAVETGGETIMMTTKVIYGEVTNLNFNPEKVQTTVTADGQKVRWYRDETTNSRYVWNPELNSWTPEFTTSLDYAHPETSPKVAKPAYDDGSKPGEPYFPSSVTLSDMLHLAEHPDLISKAASHPYYKVNVNWDSTGAYYSISIVRDGRGGFTGPEETRLSYKIPKSFAYFGLQQTTDDSGNIIYVVKKANWNPTTENPNGILPTNQGFDKATYERRIQYPITSKALSNATDMSGEWVPVFPSPPGTFGFNPATFSFRGESTNPFVAKLQNPSTINIFDERQFIINIFNAINSDNQPVAGPRNPNSVALKSLPLQLSNMILYTGLYSW